jgi:hypothetical protein
MLKILTQLAKKAIKHNFFGVSFAAEIINRFEEIDP